jgi:pimeloyl-ACP methyl ester carboxylesterase
MAATVEQTFPIPIGDLMLEGDLATVSGARATIVFAHGSGSSRKSPRNRHVARLLQQRELSTLLVDLLTAGEEPADLRFDIDLLARRLVGVSRWLSSWPAHAGKPIGYFGASTGAAAALVAAANDPSRIGAVVSRGGRPDLAASALPRVRAPTLLVVGSNDPEVLALNRHAMARLRSRAMLEVVPRAGHLFEESGTLDQVAYLAGEWFTRYLGNVNAGSRPPPTPAPPASGSRRSA